LKQFQENKKAIHPLLIEVGDFLLDIVKNLTVSGSTCDKKKISFLSSFKISLEF